MTKSRLLFCAMLLLAACGAPRHRPEPADAPSAVVGAEEPVPGPGVYRIDEARSGLRLLVHRAGTLARLGHNHVISNRALSGWARYSGSSSGAAFSFRVHTADFVVDDADERREEGGDFADDVPDDAKSGTKLNMLSAALLDAAEFPDIAVSSVAIKNLGGAPSAILRLHVAGRDSTLEVPFALTIASRELAGTGSINLRQTSLGLTPFSVMMGALQVQDEFTVKFTLVATAT